MARPFGAGSQGAAILAEVVNCAVTACPGDYLLLKGREFREGDVGNTPKHVITPLAGAGDPAGGEWDVPRIGKRSTIQIREQRTDAGNVGCLAAPEIRLVDTDEYPGAPL
jgi:hypothetical protein